MMGWVEQSAIAHFKMIPNPRTVSLRSEMGITSVPQVRRRPVNADDMQFIANAGLLGESTSFLMLSSMTPITPETNNTITETSGGAWTIVRVSWELEGVIYRITATRLQ